MITPPLLSVFVWATLEIIVIVLPLMINFAPDAALCVTVRKYPSHIAPYAEIPPPPAGKTHKGFYLSGK